MPNYSPDYIFILQLKFDKPYDVKLEYGTWRFYQDGVDQGEVKC